MSPRIAVVFPGQGSQSVGMFEPWAANDVFRRTIDEASAAVEVDLWRLACQGPPDRLGDTRLTQPLMVAAGVAVWRAWRAAGGPAPHFAAGHSVGEITALIAAGAIDYAAGMRLVRTRALAMADAVPAGTAGMAAVLGLDDATVLRLCAECASGEVLEAVNFNAAGQVAVAGHLGAIDRLLAAADAAGARIVVRLPVSGPFHSSLMAPAAAAFARALQTLDLAPLQFDVLHNIDLTPAAPATIAAALTAHLTRPVLWSATVQHFVEQGVGRIVEMGPGEVLTNLNKRITARRRPPIALNAVCTPQALARALAELPSAVTDPAAAYQPLKEQKYQTAAS